MKWIPTAVTARVARSVLVTQKNSPTILFAGGVIGVVGTVIAASRATLHLEEHLDAIESDMQKAHLVRAEKSVTEYTEREYMSDKVTIMTKGIFSIARLYGPTFVLGVTSLAALAGARHILTKRNAALTAAYGIVETALADYRGRVRDRYGDEADLELMHGVREHVYVEDTDKGPKKITAKTPAVASEYSRFFDDTCTEWNPNPEYNLVTLKAAEHWANMKLQAQHHLFLNEVYDALGIPHSSAGSVVGWVLDKDTDGDNFVDFGLFEDRPSARRFVNGNDHSILLNFNVQGLIYDLIDKNSKRVR